MKVIKSDGRYNYHSLGFTTIMEFRIKAISERMNYIAVEKALVKLYGPRNVEVGNNKFKPNENYRTQLMSDRKRRRVYLKNESDVSMLLLLTSGEQNG